MPKFDNPFATRYIKPGKVPFDLGDDERVDALVEQLRRQKWWGEITGAHGVGKSTLLASLIAKLEQAGKFVALVELREGSRAAASRAMRKAWDKLASCPRPEDAILVIDGFEQRGGLERQITKFKCSGQGYGMLVTGHEPLGLPPLCHLTADLAAVQRVVRHLTAKTPGVISQEDIAQAFSQRGDDVRELLFDLYRLYESRTKADSTASADG